MTIEYGFYGGTSRLIDGDTYTDIVDKMRALAIVNTPIPDNLTYRVMVAAQAKKLTPPVILDITTDETFILTQIRAKLIYLR